MEVIKLKPLEKKIFRIVIKVFILFYKKIDYKNDKLQLCTANHGRFSIEFQELGKPVNNKLRLYSKTFIQGCHSVFQKFFQEFQISSRFSNVHIFDSFFTTKLRLRLKTVLNSIKTLKRYCKFTLNMFF